MTLCAGAELRIPLETALGASIPEKAYFIGDFRDGDLVSVAGFANWYGHDVEVFLASMGTLGRAFLKRCGKYAFEELGCLRMSCRVSADNPWNETLPRLGFKLEGRMRHAFDGQIDMLVYGCLKEEWKYGREEAKGT